MKIQIPVNSSTRKMKQKGDYEKARSSYCKWRNSAMESKMYLCVLFALAKGICPKCGKSIILTFEYTNKQNRATLDHIEPLAVTMEHDKLGLQIMCLACNNKKGNTIETKEPNGFNFLEVATVK